MAVSILTRYSHFRYVAGITNNVVLFPSATQCLENIKLRMYKTSNDKIENKFGSANGTVKKMSKVMLAYLQRAKEHDEFMKKEIVEYNIGKRHLANMMGEDPDFFTQADIDRSIEYLFPSGLFDPKARPMMRHPEKIFPSRKAAEFDETGRPYHSMFYTFKPNYYEILYNIIDKIKYLNNIEDSLIKQGKLPSPQDKIDLISSTWLSKMEFEKVLLENITDKEFNYLVISLERLCEHPLSNQVQDFIMKYRQIFVSRANETVIPPLEHDSTGRPFITVKNCMRKSARGEVTIRGNGSGKITINGQDILYFTEVLHREQVSHLDSLL